MKGRNPSSHPPDKEALYLGSWGGPSCDSSWNSMTLPDFCPYSINTLMGFLPGSRFSCTAADGDSSSGGGGYRETAETKRLQRPPRLRCHYQISLWALPTSLKSLGPFSEPLCAAVSGINPHRRPRHSQTGACGRHRQFLHITFPSGNRHTCGPSTPSP